MESADDYDEQLKQETIYNYQTLVAVQNDIIKIKDLTYHAIQQFNDDYFDDMSDIASILDGVKDIRKLAFSLQADNGELIRNMEKYNSYVKK